MVNVLYRVFTRNLISQTQYTYYNIKIITIILYSYDSCSREDKYHIFSRFFWHIASIQFVYTKDQRSIIYTLKLFYSVQLYNIINYYTVYVSNGLYCIRHKHNNRIYKLSFNTIHNMYIYLLLYYIYIYSTTTCTL